ncbi:MAG: hypothetical protein ACKN9T_10525 [Candidatus Methylumidiphilus sp.]
MNSLFKALLLIATALVVSACNQQSNEDKPAAGANSLSVLAGSELRDLTPLLADIESKTGVKLPG